MSQNHKSPFSARCSFLQNSTAASKYSSPCIAPHYHIDGRYDRKKRLLVEKCLKDWSRDPALLLHRVKKKRLAMGYRDYECPREEYLVQHNILSLASFENFSYDLPYDVPFYTMTTWGCGQPGFQHWALMDSTWIPVVIIPCFFQQPQAHLAQEHERVFHNI